MDSSFKLLSSMTPLINKTRKNFSQKKVPRLLSLKKNVRRSSMFDNLPSTRTNENLELAEGSTTDTIDSTSTRNELRIVSSSPIVISDSDVSEVDGNIPMKSESLSLHFKRNQQNDDVLLQSKHTAISKWVLQVNSETGSNEPSSSSNVNPNKSKNVLHNFNDMLESLTTKLKEPPYRHATKTNSRQSSSSSNSCPSQNRIKHSQNNTLPNRRCNANTDNANPEINSFRKDKGLKVNPVAFKNNIDSDTNSSIGSQDQAGENLLDELYGAKWREARDTVLTKLKPRHKKEGINMEKKLKTEVRRTSKFRYTNPYLDSEQQGPFKIIDNRPTSLKITPGSPWVRQLQSLCDSDSSEQSINDIIKKYTEEPTTRLSFSNDNYSTKSSFIKMFDESVTSSAYVVSTEKPNIQGIYRLSSSDEENHEPLEDRLRKKLVLGKKTNPVEPSSKKIGGVFNKKNLDNFENKNKDKSKLDNSEDKTKKVKKVNRNIFDDKIPNSTSKKLPVKTKKKVFEKTKNDLNKKSLEFVLQPLATTNKTVPSDSAGSVSFLASLSKTVRLSQCDPAAKIFRNSFQTFKSELTTRLFKLYNENIFNNAIPQDSPLEWNDRMRGTAGYCYCKKIIRRTGQLERKVRIVLSTKVLDSADRLRDTLIHEMCHAATWIVNEVANGHGIYWKAWAHKARQAFPELPPIKRCHDYVINTKYTYKCVDCGYSIGRHSKSLDIERKRCGYCYGKFEVLINKISKDGEAKSVPVTPKKAPSAFALFVKEHYAMVRTPQLNHGQVMKLLGQKYSELKVTVNED